MHKPPVRMRGSDYFAGAFPLNIQERVRLTEPFALHWHDFYELTYVFEGQGRDVINGQPYRTGGGALQLLSPSDFHEVIPEPGEVLVLTNIQFTRELVADELYEALFGRREALMLRLEGEPRERMERLIALLHEQSRDKAFGYERAARAALELVLLQLARLAQRGEPAPRRPADGSAVPLWLRQALPYLERHYREGIRLKEAAAHVGLSPGYFSDAFHKAVGTTFQRYMLELRLGFAYALLRSSRVPVTEVCYASGFNTLTYFEHKFKERYGLTPRAARKAASSAAPRPGAQAAGPGEGEANERR